MQQKMQSNNDSFDLQLDRDDTIISEENPLIQTKGSESICIRFGKCLDKAKQHQWISQFDMYSVPIKLHLNGKDTFKTQFGGLIYLFILIICIVLTIKTQFQAGTLNRYITLVELIQDAGNTNKIFDNGMTMFEFSIYNYSSSSMADLSILSNIIISYEIYQVFKGVSTPLQVSTNCRLGQFCFSSSNLNSEATLYSRPHLQDSAYLQLQIMGCDVNSLDPVLQDTLYGGSICWNIIYHFDIRMTVINYKQITGGLEPYTENLIISLYGQYDINVDRKQYTTNSPFFGHFANILSYQIDYYYIVPDARYGYGFPIYTPTHNYQNNIIFASIRFGCSGSTDIVTQTFDDITVPLVFFLSTSQTLFLIAYIFFVKNYTSNSMYLYIADSLVYMKNLKTGRHHKFKSGISTFMACIINNHFYTKAIDFMLYKFFQTHLKKHLSQQMQLTIEMIQYGEKIMGQRYFFDNINAIYEQQNTQPSKIIIAFNDQTDQKENEQNKKKVEQFDEQKYFDDDEQTEAFRRMCEQHEYYSSDRKKHLATILKKNDKNYKLVGMTQKLYGEYLRGVREETMSKQCHIPLKEVQQLTAQHFKLNNSNVMQ